MLPSVLGESGFFLLATAYLPSLLDIWSCAGKTAGARCAHCLSPVMELWSWETWGASVSWCEQKVKADLFRSRLICLSLLLSTEFWLRACSLFIPLIPIHLPSSLLKIIFQMPKWAALQNTQCVFCMFLPSLRINYSWNLGMLHLSPVVKRHWRILPWQAVIADNCSFYANLGVQGTANVAVGSAQAHSCSSRMALWVLLCIAMGCSGKLVWNDH